MESGTNQRGSQARRERHARMSPSERVALALRLGVDGLASFMQTQGVDKATAIRRIKAANRLGRRDSACAVGRAD